MENVRALKEKTILNEQYEIVKLIGEGGFGITYLAFDKYLKINVCIKEYFPTAFATRDVSAGNNELTVISGEREKLFNYGMSKFEKEANTLSRFSDLDGTVRILNFFFQNKTAYMVMEYIDGISLREYLERNGNKIGYSKVLQLMQPVIESLSIVHKAGLIHRDISPDNIMYSSEGKIKIIDFGAAKEYEDERSQAVMLKHGYAPPEQYSKNGKQGTWTDVYSLCATMYKMITGNRMPEALSIMTGVSVVKSIRSFDKSIPAKIENAIMRGLDLDSKTRIQNMDELREVLYGQKTVPRAKKYKEKIYYNRLIKPVVIIGVIIVVAIAGIALARNRIDATTSGKETNETKKGSSFVQKEKDIPEVYNSLKVPFESTFIYQNAKNGVVITGVSNTIDSMAYPSMIGGKAVVEINASSKNVVIALVPEGVKRIGDNAFKNCVYLENVYIPSTVEYISETAFSNCKNLKRIDISADNPNYYVKDNTEIKAY